MADPEMGFATWAESDEQVRKREKPWLFGRVWAWQLKAIPLIGKEERGSGMILEELLVQVFERGASDLHLSPGLPPVLRIDGNLVRTEHAPLSKEDCQRLIFSMLTNEQRRVLEQNWDLDCSYGVSGLGRFRVNVYKDRGSYAAALRTIRADVPTFEQLNLPQVVKEIAERPKGLVLVTGPTGSGKSTTLAAMIDHINCTKPHHILTVEDPIEFLHTSKRAVIHQRELGQDTRSFDNALRAALREDPDVILVGEMRDLETIRLALTAAETGHLVMGTLHTSSAMQTVDRIVDVFPPEQQQQIRVQLSNSLVAVLSQALLPKLNELKEKSGRVMALEIMIITPAIANLIREGKTAQIYSSIQTGAQYQMQTMETSLKDLYQKGLVTFEDALSKTTRPEDFKRLVSGGGATR
jgi:twitching motility protein PilT